MSNWIKISTGINVLIYRVSNGLLGSKLGRQSMLLLYTRGRKTDKVRITTLAYYREGDNYLVVGSNWGKETQPGWFHNLMQQPRASIQVGGRKINIEARRAEGEEYERLWQLVTRQNGQYITYQKSIKRRIPIIILMPIDTNQRDN